MDIALRVPELVHSHDLRSHINKVKGDRPAEFTADCCKIAQGCSASPDASAEHQVSPKPQRIKACPPGP